MYCQEAGAPDPALVNELQLRRGPGLLSPNFISNSAFIHNLLKVLKVDVSRRVAQMMMKVVSGS